MKKGFNVFAICWVLSVALFNVLAFVVPAWPTLEKYGPSFWIGYAFVMLSFLVELAISYIALRVDSINKLFYNLPMFTVSCSGLGSVLVFGIIFMVVTPLPYWIGAIVCPIVVILNVIAVLKAKLAGDVAADTEAKVERATAFIHYMRDVSEALLARAKTDDVKLACKKVHEAFKYSDPMSVEVLSSIENEIDTHFEAFRNAVKAEDSAVIFTECDELLALVAERSAKCKRFK